MMENRTKYDAVIIGFGKGGKTMAGALGAAGKKVALIEKSDRMYGGTCINVGCIPTKSLVYRAGLAAAKGGSFEEKAAAYKAAMEQKEDLTARLRGKNYQKLDSNPNITIIDGTAVSSRLMWWRWRRTEGPSRWKESRYSLTQAHPPSSRPLRD